MINKKYYCFFVVVLCLVISNLNVYGCEWGYYYDYRIEGQTSLLQESKYEFNSEDIEEKIYELFANLVAINYNENRYNLINKDVDIKSVYFDKGKLEVSFSKEVLNYGGTMWETDMIDQFLSTFFSVEEVESISFYINRETTLFVEGTEIVDFNRNQLKGRLKRDNENRNRKVEY